MFAVLAVACGLGVTRALRVPLSLAPMSGLAAMAVIGVWCSALGTPPQLGTGLVVTLALAGAITVLISRPSTWHNASACRGPLLVLALATAIPATAHNARIAPTPTDNGEW